MQRVTEIARRLGLPVVVTDLAGREPMVVISLEQFEAMAGTAGEAAAVPAATSPSPRPVARPVPEPSPTPVPPRPEPKPDLSPQLERELYPSGLDMTREEGGKAAEAPRKGPETSPNEQKTAQPEESSLEERFYLEPVEDESV